MWWYIVVLIVCVVIYLTITYYLEKFEIENIHQKSVFITGCDSGFGHLLALKLIENGATVFAGCLTEAGEIELKKKSAIFPGSLMTLRLDVTKAESVQKALEIVTNQCEQTGTMRSSCTCDMFSIRIFFLMSITQFKSSKLTSLGRGLRFCLFACLIEALPS